MSLYFYAPLYSGSPEVIRNMEQDDGSIAPETITLDFRTSPGKDSGSGPEYDGDTPKPGLACLLYDTDNTRVVCSIPSLDPIPAGWVSKTEAEVQADYPSLGV